MRVLWSGRQPRLWGSVVKELKEAERLTRFNDVITLNFCVNYGGRAEIADAVAEISRDIRTGVIAPRDVDEQLISSYLYQPDLPNVDLFLRTGGEQRTSNFLLWQSAYAEMMFIDEAWPEVNREVLWRCLVDFARRDRRFGGAQDTVAGNDAE